MLIGLAGRAFQASPTILSRFGRYDTERAVAVLQHMDASSAATVAGLRSSSERAAT